MSEGLVAFGHRIAGAFARGLDEYMACHAEDVVHVTAPEWPERGTYRGREEVRELWASIFADFAEYEIDVDDVTVIDDHRILVETRWHTRGSTSGAVTTTIVYSVATERDGLVSRIEYFLDHGKALEAAGLSE